MNARRKILPLTTFALLLGLAACSNQQVGNFLGNLCHGADNCTSYNSDGTPVEGRWYHPH